MKLTDELVAVIDRARMRLVNSGEYDESKHPRAKDGKFTSGSGGADQEAAKLETEISDLKGGKKSEEELMKINPWDDEKTRKMKMRWAKMRQKNQALNDDIAKRKTHIEEMKKDISQLTSAGFK